MIKTGMTQLALFKEAKELGIRIDEQPIPEGATRKGRGSGKKYKLWLPNNTIPVEFAAGHIAPQFVTRAIIRWQTSRDLSAGLPNRDQVKLPDVSTASRPNITGSDVAGFAARLETISPEIAMEWIAITEKNGDQNRKINDLRVDALARTIRDGKWDPYNGETFKLYPNGSVGDGQHRLWGIVFANESVKALVVRNVPKESFATIDVGMPRGASTVVSLAGKANGNHLAAVARLLYQMKVSRTLESGIRPIARKLYLAPHEVLRIITDNPTIADATRVASHTKQNKLTVMPVTAVAAAYFCCAQIAPQQAKEFFDVQLPGKDPNQSAHHPARRLREAFVNARLRHITISTEVALAMIFKGWNAYRTESPVQIISYKPDTENFPMIDGGDKVVIV